MKHNGFTLIELLFSIAILTLIMAIAVPSINGISGAIRESQRKNKIESIEIAASKYAFDTGETLIFVNKLVTEGYIESDDENGNIEDPVNNEKLNCYVVEMEKQSDYYNAKFIDGKKYETNGSCDESKLNANNAGIKIQVMNNNTVVSRTNNWLKGSVTLTALGTNSSIIVDCITNKCVWSSSSGATSSESSTELKNVSGLLNTTYTFQMTVYNSGSSDVKRYKNSVNLKIDNEAPVIYENEISTTNKFIYTSSKTVTIEASDGKGSGIDGYYLALNTGQNCNENSIVFQKSRIFTINKNGSYLICVKDNVGNISSYSGLTINYIK